jgi:hypothetical protein
MYTIDEGQLTIPQDWKDETVNVLTTSTDGTPAFSLAITRDDLPQGTAFSDYAKQEVEKISSSLPEFKLIEEQDTYRIDGHAAHRLEYLWKSTEGQLHQMVAFTSKQQRVIVFTASAPDALTEPQKKQVTQMLMSFRFRQ